MKIVLRHTAIVENHIWKIPPVLLKMLLAGRVRPEYQKEYRTEVSTEIAKLRMEYILRKNPDVLKTEQKTQESKPKQPERVQYSPPRGSSTPSHQNQQNQQANKGKSTQPIMQNGNRINVSASRDDINKAAFM
eukprot:TRINITY_DN6181_c0_g1_i2.p1 TRINITY_DN6181_c0_g1~~TRINITY_DN6181_c0_g1_i2.p1  ORF type:complete len:133 (-),score=17.82 TRINITY_DN6181_c0_g1_i2:65-463(-)